MCIRHTCVCIYTSTRIQFRMTDIQTHTDIHIIYTYYTAKGEPANKAVMTDVHRDIHRHTYGQAIHRL